MATSDELTGFVREALARGTPRAQVGEILLRTGWSRDQVTAALAAYAEVEFPIPVPRPRPYLSARDAFMYLLLFSMLYVSAYTVGVIVFDYINRAFPDAAFRTWQEFSRQSVRWALASLVVSFPVFVYLSALVARDIRLDPAKSRSNVRRWLMYLTVFVAASVLIGDFITLVYNALGGELSARFLLKVLTIAVIAGTVFAYYLSDLRLEDTKPVADDRRWRRGIAAAAIVATGAVVIAGFALIGSPSEERARRLDHQRAGDLSRISQSVNVYSSRHKRVPSSLDDLRPEGLHVPGRDASDAEAGPYEYRATGGKTYELCATFQRDSTADPLTRGDFWAHGAGRRCFQLEAKEVQ